MAGVPGTLTVQPVKLPASLFAPFPATVGSMSPLPPPIATTVAAAGSLGPLTSFCLAPETPATTAMGALQGVVGQEPKGHTLTPCGPDVACGFTVGQP